VGRYAYPLHFRAPAEENAAWADPELVFRFAASGFVALTTGPIVYERERQLQEIPCPLLNTGKHVFVRRRGGSRDRLLMEKCAAGFPTETHASCQVVVSGRRTAKTVPHQSRYKHHPIKNPLFSHSAC
jgi:hypothetical protein